MFIGKYNKSVILTYIGVAFAFSGMAFALYERLPAAMLCLIAAGICDLFDGAAARRCKRDETAKEFGVQIDSLADDGVSGASRGARSEAYERCGYCEVSHNTGVYSVRYHTPCVVQYLRGGGRLTDAL